MTKSVRELTAEQVAPEGNPSSWRAHPRLQRHVRKLVASSSPYKVLNRYYTIRKAFRKVGTERYIVHVAAWVALLPQRSDLLPDCAKLLASLLPKRRCFTPSKWLQGVLQLVVDRIREFARECTLKREQWVDLDRRIQKSCLLSLQSGSTFRRQDPGEETCMRYKSSISDHSDGEVVRTKTSQSIMEMVEQRAKLQKLYMRKKRFEAMAAGERSSWMASLQEQTDEVVRNWDPVAAGKLSHRLVALLSPPRYVEQTQSREPSSSGAASDIRSFQKQVHTMLWSVLNILDFGMPDTQQSMQCVSSYILMMLQDFEGRGRHLSDVRCSQQWQRLKALFHEGPNLSTDPSIHNIQEHDHEVQRNILKETQPVKNGRCRHADRARISESYEPGARVKALPTVEQRTVPTVLKCQECSHTVSSSWYFVHPQTKELAVLVPIAGHAACGRKLGKRAYFMVEDKSPYKMDNFGNVDYCEHGRMRKDCAPCGGKGLCEHGKQRRCCKFCCILIKHRRHHRKVSHL